MVFLYSIIVIRIVLFFSIKELEKVKIEMVQKLKEMEDTKEKQREEVFNFNFFK